MYIYVVNMELGGLSLGFLFSGWLLYYYLSIYFCMWFFLIRLWFRFNFQQVYTKFNLCSKYGVVFLYDFCLVGDYSIIAYLYIFVCDFFEACINYNFISSKCTFMQLIWSWVVFLYDFCLVGDYSIITYLYILVCDFLEACNDFNLSSSKFTIARLC